MSELTVAARYAKSLIDLSQEQGILEDVKIDIGFFVQTLKSSTELQAVLRNPIIPHDRKIKILDAIFADKVNIATIGFFKIMINKSRGDILYYTAQEFINQYNLKKGIVKATITSAAPLSPATLDEIKALVQKDIGGNIVVETKINPALIGGFVLTVGDKQIDSSIATSLQRLKKDFAQKAV
jgi:F-type H+-transporting ATPase subunit delta